MYQLTLQITDTQLEQSLRQLAQKEDRNIPEMALIAIQQFVQHRLTTDNEQNDPWDNPITLCRYRHYRLCLQP